MRVVAILSSLVLLAHACGGSEEPVLVQAPEDPGLLFQGDQEAPVVATVGDWKITTADLAAVHPVKDGATVEESLQALIDRALVVQSALADLAGRSRFSTVLAWRRALAGRWIHHRMEEVFRKDNIPTRALKAIYDVTWYIYNHVNTFYIADAQFICCHAAYHDCDKAAVRECQDENIDKFSVLYSMLRERNVSDLDEFRDTVSEFADKYDMDVGVVDYAFQYDHSKPYSEQRGYDLYEEHICLAVKDLKVGHFTGIVRSGFGLHILYLKKFLPEEHRTLDDPGVRKDIAERYYPMLQKREVVRVFQTLTGKADVQLFPETIKEVDWKKVTGLGQ